MLLRIRKVIRKFAWEGERLRWRLFHPITLGARVMLIREGQVLLVEHTYQRGMWYLPGGGVDKGETLEEAARREAMEEAGATVRELVLLGMYSSFGQHKSDHLAIFVSRDFDCVLPPPDDEIARREWFSLDALPPGLSPGTARRFEDLAAGGPPRGNAW